MRRGFLLFFSNSDNLYGCAIRQPTVYQPLPSDLLNKREHSNLIQTIDHSFLPAGGRYEGFHDKCS